MTHRDSQPVGDGASRRATRGDDSPHVAEGRDDKAFPNAGESKYPATAPRRPASEPLKVHIELVVVDGPAAGELLKKQATVIREALQWFADHRLDEHDQELNAGAPRGQRPSRPPAQPPATPTKMDDSHDDA